VEASDAAPTETIRYASLLLEDDRAFLAEELVIDALRRAPGHPELLSLLGEHLSADGRLVSGRAGRRAPCGTGAEASPGRSVQDRDPCRARGRPRRRWPISKSLPPLGMAAICSAQIAVIRARLSTGDGAGALSYTPGPAGRRPDNIALR
jgi:hypothetical protein